MRDKFRVHTVDTDDLRRRKVEFVRGEMLSVLSSKRGTADFTFFDPESDTDYEETTYGDHPMHKLSLRYAADHSGSKSLHAISELKMEIDTILICGSESEIKKWLECDESLKTMCNCYTTQTREILSTPLKGIEFSRR